MTDDTKKFHEFALQSSLFKGHTDWYFSFLKSERIAHIVTVLTAQQAFKEVEAMLIKAHKVPDSVLYFAAGSLPLPELLADILSTITTLRMCEGRGLIEKENVLLLIKEYEIIAQRIATKFQPTPFLTTTDLEVPMFPQKIPETLNLYYDRNISPKGQNKGHQGQSVSDNATSSLVRSDRTEKILSFVAQNKGVSIKQISSAVKGYGEKTIQRELSTLIKLGLIRKIGERRWSTYFVA